MAEIEGPSVRRLRDPSWSLWTIPPPMSIDRQVLASRVCHPTEEIAGVFDLDQICANLADVSIARSQSIISPLTVLALSQKIQFGRVTAISLDRKPMLRSGRTWATSGRRSAPRVANPYRFARP